MSTTKTLGEAPKLYNYCSSSDCTAKDTCLRHLGLQEMDDKAEFVTIINPKRITPTQGTACPYYRKAETLRFAFGFTKAFGRICADSVISATNELMLLSSSRTYYRMRSGQYPLSPELQAKIAEILVKYGAKEPIEFDSYQDCYNW